MAKKDPFDIDDLDLEQEDLEEDTEIEEDDEEEDAEEVVVQTPAPVKKPTAVAKRESAPPATLDFTKIFSDFGPDMANNPAVVVGAVGMTISRFPIERVKFTKEKKDRISILTEQVLAVKTHYHEDIGSFMCFGGYCCDVADTPRVKYVLPIVVYTTDNKGKILNKDVTLKVLAIGQEQYDAIVTIAENSEASLTDMDIIVSCSDADYQKCTYTKVDRPGASWKKSKETAQFVAEEYSKVKGHLLDSIARSLTEKQIKERLAGSDNGATAGTDLGMDDVFDDDK